ncbi:MAG: hypothetical protein JWM89_976 [Acidimicrobiales bacterium]|nr:hypothetical protein [Acidimicrobiales bacterium]
MADPDLPLPEAGPEPLLQLRGIVKRFGAVEALHGVDLEVPAGQVTALVGDNGAGKSVLIKCIAGIVTPDAGQISWQGRPVSIHTPRDAAALGIETVHQDLALCDNLDIVQNMFLGREKLRHGLLDEESMERAARETLTGLAVTTVRSVRQPVASLSGGQRQSVAIAKAVLWNSGLVIMDEPTAALGVSQTAMVLDLVRRLADGGLAVILVSHNMNDVFEVADRIAVLRLGRMVDVRPAAELDRQIVVDLMTSGASSRTAVPGSSRSTADPAPSDDLASTDPPSATVGATATANDEANGSDSQAALAAAPEVMADSLAEYVRGWYLRVKGGDSGVLPVVGGLILISALFQILNGSFLTAGNLVNLLVQGAAYMLLAMAEVFVLLLGEIDLSIGFVSGIGGIVVAELVKQHWNYPWWAGIAIALAACTLIGLLQGTIITRVGLPSFVVTLAGLLGWQGVMLMILGTGGSQPINNSVINDISSGNLTAAASWAVMLVLVAAFAARTWLHDARRRAGGLVAPPVSLTLVKIAGALVAGVAVISICNTDRGRLIPIRGLPWVVLVVLGVLAAWTFLLGRTRFGRYIYAIGGNAEAARRAGVSLAGVRTTAFALASFTGGIAGIVYASRLRSVSTALDGGQLVLYAVAAAVIGGTSLFGGRGKALHAVLGGLVIAAIDNGMGLQGYSAAAKYTVTALVLLAAVTIDAIARRGSAAVA